LCGPLNWHGEIRLGFLLVGLLGVLIFGVQMHQPFQHLASKRNFVVPEAEITEINAVGMAIVGIIIK